jgi:hypothetical protein
MYVTAQRRRKKKSFSRSRRHSNRSANYFQNFVPRLTVLDEQKNCVSFGTIIIIIINHRSSSCQANKMVKIGTKVRLFASLAVLKVARSLAPIDGRTSIRSLRRQFPSVLFVRGGQDDDHNSDASEKPEQLQAANRHSDQQPLEATWSSADNESRQVSISLGEFPLCTPLHKF